MEIGNWVTENAALTSLNVVPPAPAVYTRFLKQFAEGSTNAPLSAQGRLILCQWEDGANQRVKDRYHGFILNYLANAPTFALPSSPEGRWQLPPTISQEESQPFRAALTSAHLRTYVDAWLETGRSADGYEQPGKRSLNRAFHADRAFWDYLKDAPAIFRPSNDSSIVRLGIAEPTAFKGMAENFFVSQIVSAKRLFVGILLSDWKDGLCKCRYSRCGRYFSHPNPHEHYKRGTFCCPKHASHAAAAVSMLKSRTHGTSILIEAAARKLRTWKIRGRNWFYDVDLKRRLAEELCLVISGQRLHGYRQQVSANWVTRHHVAIERKRLELK